MIGLIYNEISKIVAQRRFVVIIVFLTIVAVLSALVARSTHIMEGIPITAAQEASGGVTVSAQLFFPIFFAIIIGDIVAGELSGGTLKLLLIRPDARWKIWLSKLIAAFIGCVLLVLYCGLCSYIASGATVGFGSWSAPEGGQFNIVASAFSVTLRVYALEMVSIFSVVSLFVFISTVVESGVAAVALCTMITVMCSIAAGVINFIAPFTPNARFFEYAFFEHWQIASHVTRTFPVHDWSITGSLVTLVVWAALFITSGITIFQVKDVKG